MWDGATGQRLTKLFEHRGPVVSAQFSPNGQWIVTTVSKDKTAHVWDALTGQPLTYPLAHNGRVFSARFSPDGQRIVTASRDKTARVWDARTGLPLTEPLRHNEPVYSVEFSPDGQRVVTGSADRTARVWDAWSGQPLTEPLRHSATVQSAQFSPDGQRIVTASADKTAQVWDVRAGKLLTESLRHKDAVLCVQFSPDSQLVVTASSDNTARVWDARNAQPLIQPLRHKDGVCSVQFSPDGLRVVTASWDGTALLWDARTGQPLTKPLVHDGAVYFVRFSSDGQWVVTASADKTARVWDARTGQPRTGPLEHHGPVWSAQFSLDGQRIVTASADKTARVWDARTGQPLTEPLIHDHEVLTAQFSSNGQWVVTASRDKTARVWEARTGLPLTEPLRHDDVVDYAQFSPDGLKVVTASSDRTARVWDARTGHALTEPLRHEASVRYAQFSPDGKRIVTASMDRTARVWDTGTGLPLTEPLNHNTEVLHVQFSPDGQRIVTASLGGIARLWDVPAVQLPIPDWMLELAETVAGVRINDREVSEAIPVTEVLRLKSAMVNRPATNTPSRWVRWFFADRTTRTISPNSFVTVSHYIGQCIQANTPQDLMEAVQISPTNGLASARLARIRLDESQAQNPRASSEADFFMRRALELSPDEPEVWVAQAEVLRHSGRQPEATTAINSALERLPQAPALWFAKGRFLEEAKRPEEAITAFSRAIELAESGLTPAILRHEALDHRASLLRSLNRIAESNADYETLVRMEYSFGDDCNYVAKNIMASGDPELAIILAQRAVELEPKNWVYRNTLGMAQFRAGDHRKAKEALREASRLNPNGQSADNLFFLAMAEFKLGNLQNATKYYQQALRWVEKLPTGAQINWSELQMFQAETEKLLGIRLNLPARDSAVGDNLLDLSAFYNARLQRNWYGDEPGNNLAGLVTQIHTLAGTDFDARALIQVQRSSEIYPAQITNIPVARTCWRLHFLHAAIKTAGLTNGTLVGRYVIHLDDGTRYEMPLLLGRDLADWWEQSAETKATFTVAWTGTNPKSQRTGDKIRLFKSTWENSQSNKVVLSIDFQATHNTAAPFLIAITAEP